MTGGNNAEKTSIYDVNADAWIAGANMNIPRGYQSQATLSDGRIFTIGGSWSGGQGNKNGEVYQPTSNQWALLSGTSFRSNSFLMYAASIVVYSRDMSHSSTLTRERDC